VGEVKLFAKAEDKDIAEQVIKGESTDSNNT